MKMHTKKHTGASNSLEEFSAWLDDLKDKGDIPEYIKATGDDDQLFVEYDNTGSNVLVASGESTTVGTISVDGTDYSFVTFEYFGSGYPEVVPMLVAIESQEFPGNEEAHEVNRLIADTLLADYPGYNLERIGRD